MSELHYIYFFIFFHRKKKWEKSFSLGVGNQYIPIQGLNDSGEIFLFLKRLDQKTKYRIFFTFFRLTYVHSIHEKDYNKSL